MENKMEYTAPEMTFEELVEEDIVLISVNNGTGQLPTVPFSASEPIDW